MKISKETYNLFLKYGSELLWLSDPLRERRPKDTNENTDKAFMVLQRLDANMELFHNDNYSQKLKSEFGAIIENLKPEVLDEVFKLIEDKYKNNMTKYLFVCSANKQRSRTAQDLFKKQFPELEFDSGGTNHKLCLKEGTTPLSEEQVIWADRVYVMEEKHKQIINAHTDFRYQKKIEVLNIPDEFEYYQTELIDLLRSKVQPELIKR